MSAGAKEKRFLDALESLFTGAEVDGDSGFVNLMRMKHRHFLSVRPILMERIDSRVPPETSFREELFDKLYTFFSRHFCESGSIYFRHLPTFAKIYERVYSGEADVELTWKTKALYYVKSDILVRSMPVKLMPEREYRHAPLFYFDASDIEHKKNNERREFIFRFAGTNQTEGEVALHLMVSHSQNGTKTNAGDIIKQARDAEPAVHITEQDLQSAIAIFQRQTEADFFINKDAGSFLREQFDLWLYQYMFSEESIFEQQRLEQLQAIKHTALDIINYIAQFEDELRRIWEKPKFSRNVNYVVTLDKLSSQLLEKISVHKSASKQVKEWQELGMVDKNFSMASLNRGQAGLNMKNDGGPTNGACRFLPLDTKHFKNLEVEILGELGNLDKALDGEFVHSENWQALNTLRKRYLNKIKCIYIDPPFNLDSGDQFDYRTNYKDSCWLTMLENRLSAAKPLISDGGTIVVRCGHDGNYLLRSLLNNVFGIENYRNEIVVRRAEEEKGELMKQFDTMRAMMVNYDNLYWYSVNPQDRFNFITKPSSPEQKKSQWHPFWKAEDRPDLRYEILGVTLDRGQWMWEKDRSSRAIQNYQKYMEQARKISLEKYWKRNQSEYYDATGHKLEFIRKNENGNGGPSSIQYWIPPRNFIISDNNWIDVKGYANTTGFKTENSEMLLYRIIDNLPNQGEVVADFFAGSGTTQAVAQKLGRKWLGVEMGEHFNEVILPRMKKIINGQRSDISSKAGYQGGGVFKYYALEQYEETLKKARYADGEQLELDSTKSPFEQYVFFNDDKFTHTVKLLKNGKLSVNLRDLYPDIDIAESIANILGKQIQRRTGNTVTFVDGTTEKINPAKMTGEERQHFISLLKPYLWWGE